MQVLSGKNDMIKIVPKVLSQLVFDNSINIVYQQLD